MTVDDVLNKNAYLKGSGKNGRCFILGNGPSLGKQDIKMLKNETKIVVNSFYHHADAKEINPDYWFLADPAYWRNPERYLFPVISNIKEKAIFTKMFISVQAVPLFSKLNYGITIDPHFFLFDYTLKHIPDIDFTKGLPPLGQTVVITSIMLAFFLGFKDIYLLGCDHDILAYTKENYDTIPKEQHFYPTYIPPEEVPSYESEARSVERVKFEYAVLKKYAKEKGIRIYNATAGGYLELFPRVKYEHLFPETMYNGLG